MAPEPTRHRVAPRLAPVCVAPVWVILGMTGLLVWPAVWNGYPIVFADTGTYLSQAVHRYLGWDRPAFYSLFMLPLHATVTTWPVVVAQAALVAWVLALVWRVLAPGRPQWWLLPGTLVLSLATWLPWLASELMPDVFTPLVVLGFCLLAVTPDRLRRWERVVLVVLLGFMIATAQSSVAQWTCLLLAVSVIAAARWCSARRSAGDRRTAALPPRDGAVASRPAAIPGRSAASRAAGDGATASRPAAIPPSAGPGGGPPRLVPTLRLCLPLGLAVLALCSANQIGHGRFALSPYGNVFLLARMLSDGPALQTMRDLCPERRWSLCPYLDRITADSDLLLWAGDSPILASGGHKALSAEAGAIIAATWGAYPGWVAWTAARNSLTQLVRFASGDGLGAWPAEVSPWIERDFPAAERAAYAAARQQAADLTVPLGLGVVHVTVAVAGMVLAVVLLLRRGRCGMHAAFLALVLLSLVCGAVITGALSRPHDRYQARLAFLPALVGVMALIGPVRRPG